MIFSCSMIEPGHPCVMISGNAFRVLIGQRRGESRDHPQGRQGADHDCDRPRQASAESHEIGLRVLHRKFEIEAGGTQQIAAKLVPRDDKPAVAAKGWHGWPADAPPAAIAPFDEKQAKQHQAAWAKHLGVPVEYTNSIGMKFVLIRRANSRWEHAGGD